MINSIDGQLALEHSEVIAHMDAATGILELVRQDSPDSNRRPPESRARPLASARPAAVLAHGWQVLASKKLTEASVLNQWAEHVPCQIVVAE